MITLFDLSSAVCLRFPRLNGSSIQTLTLIILLASPRIAAPGSAEASPPIVSGVMTQQFTGSTPGCIALADMNEDGTLDLLVSEASEVVLYPVRTDGTPRAGTTLISGRMNALAVADIDGDGHTDVIGSSVGPTSIIIAYGTGTGAVSHTQAIPTSVQAFGVITGDFNEDSLIDVAAAVPNLGALVVALANGGGTFGPATTLPGGYYPYYVVAGDFNGDGHLDIADADQSTVGIRLGVGDGTFAARIPASSAGNPTSLTSTDVNADGILDLVTSNGNSPNEAVSVFLGNGDGTVLPRTIIAAAGYGHVAAIADMNADGVPDLVLALTDLGQIALYIGDGGGAFTLSSTTDVGYQCQPVVVTAADLNGDGRTDVAVASSGTPPYFQTSSASVILGDGAGGFLSQAPYPVGGSPQYMAAGRIDHGPQGDIVVSGTGNNQISVLFNYDGKATLQRKDLATNPYPGQVATADLNNDGVDDILLLSNSTNLNVFLSNGDGSFRPRLDFSLSTAMNLLAVRDLNGDGRPDVVTVSLYYNTISVLMNYLGVTFLPEVTYPTGPSFSSPTSLAMADINADGKVDAIVGFGGGQGICTMIGNGAGGFAFGQGLAPPGTTSLASSDLNGDGSPDLVARGTGGLTVYANNGAGAFGAGVPVPLATGSARSILATDLTGDGIPDIAVADDSRNILSVHVGMGGLTYKEPVLYQAGSSPQTILPVDVDRDGGTDIVCLNYSTGAVSWFRNLAVRAPVIAAPDDVVGNESQSISFAVAANDPDGGTITSLTADLSTLPPGNAATFSASSGNQTGQFSWTPGFSDAGVYEVSFKAVSARVGTATTQITVANVDRAPVLGPVADQMVGEGETIDVDVSATDPDGQQVLIEISGPAFASIVSAVVTGGTTNGVLRLAPGITDAGTYPACEIRATAGVYSVVTQFAIIVANSEIEQPRITSVADVPLDQGGQVKVSWLASASDVTPGGRVDEYWVWRSTPSSVALAALAAKSAYVATAGATRPSPGGRMLQRSGSGDFYWEFLVAQPAGLLSRYSYVARTTSDSTSLGNPYTAFFVQARSHDGQFRWDSAVDSGYSIDNVPPGQPHGVVAFLAPGRSVRLHWNPNTDEDISHYAVYKGTTADFALTAQNRVGTSPDTTLVDRAYSPGAYYKVTAVDIHENESPWTLLGPQQITSVDGAAAPRVAYLKQNYPNPFNPQTAIEFGLPASGSVSIMIFDARGRLVRTLLHGTRPAGVQWVVWDGNGDSGAPVSSGIYVARLTGGGAERTVKMVLTR